MGLFDLVEQHHGVGPPTYRFGQHTAFPVADIAREASLSASKQYAVPETRTY